MDTAVFFISAITVFLIVISVFSVSIYQKNKLNKRKPLSDLDTKGLIMNLIEKILLDYNMSDEKIKIHLGLFKNNLDLIKSFIENDDKERQIQEAILFAKKYYESNKIKLTEDDFIIMKDVFSLLHDVLNNYLSFKITKNNL